MLAQEKNFMTTEVHANNHIITLDGIEGALFVGDPHASTRKPGTRNDKDFASTVLGKLEQSVKIANENNAALIILGDLFDRENDSDGQVGRSLLTRIIRVLRQSKTPPVVLASNHDKNGIEVTDDTIVAALSAADVIHLVQDTELFLHANLVGGKVLVMGGSPWGKEIPADIAPYLESANIPDGENVIKAWITHEDLAFDGAYPGALEMFEIRNCDIVVNGHMHLTKPEVQVGRTLWCNPGNITRQSKDCADHVPSVWLMKDKPQLTQIPLEYERNVFDAVMNHVAPIKAGATPMASSNFVDMLKAASKEIKTEDGSLLLQDIKEVSADLNLSSDAQAILLAVHEEAMMAPAG